MVTDTGRYTVITGASSGIGYETAKVFAERGSHLIIAARRKGRLENLKQEISVLYPSIDVVIKTTDLSISNNAFRFYEDVKTYPLKTWINNAGFGNYDSVSHQDLKKIQQMLHLNVEALTILSSLFVRDFKDTEGTQLINISSCGGYTIVPNAVNLLCGEILCQHFYRGAGVGVKAVRGKDESKGISPGRDKNGVWKSSE